MVSQVGLNPISNSSFPSLYTNGGVQQNYNNSLFGTNSQLMPNNDYADDVMMTSIDFNQLANSLNQQQSLQNNNNVTFSGNPQDIPVQTEEVEAQEEDSGGSNIAKILCSIGGFVAPIVGRLVSWIKGGNPKDLFKFKQLAVACPVLAVAGLGVGMLIDACINATNNSKSDEEQKEQQVPNQNIQIPPKLDSVT
jgi:hypothetical protein